MMRHAQERRPLKRSLRRGSRAIVGATAERAVCRVWVVWVVCAVCVVVAACDPPIPAWTDDDAAILRQAPPDNPFVHAVGTELFDGHNQRVWLRGVNLGNWLVWEGWMWGGGWSLDGERVLVSRLGEVIGADEAQAFREAHRATFIDDDDIGAIAALGLNTVRLPLNHTVLEREPDDIDDERFVPREEGFSLLERFFASCERHGVRVILDLHAAPGGQSGAFMADPDDGPRLFDHRPFQRRTIGLWQELARRYGDRDVVAGYDLLNEPDPPSSEALISLYREIAAAIRTIDPHHLILLEGTAAASRLDAFIRAVTWNQMYSMHQYTFFGDYRRDELRRWSAVAEAHQVPLHIGEFGIAEVATIADSVKLYDDVDGPVQGFALWSYKVVDGGDAHPCRVAPGPRWKALAEYMNRGGSPPTREMAMAGIDDYRRAVSTCALVVENARALGADAGDIDDARAIIEPPTP